mgnify:CR=1 FL=1
MSSANQERKRREYEEARRLLEAGLRDKGKLPEPMKYEPPKDYSLFGDPFSRETKAELAKLPSLAEDLNELRLIAVGLESGMRDEALNLAKLRRELKDGGKT